MNDDRTLDRLAHSAVRAEEDGTARPSDMEIVAYVHGDATEDERRRVHRALLGSASFRREVAALARAAALLERDDAATFYDATPTPSPPPLTELLERSHHPTTDRNRGGVDADKTEKRSTPPQRNRTPWVARIVEMFSRTLLHPALGYSAAALMAGVLWFQSAGPTADRGGLMGAQPSDVLTATLEPSGLLMIRGGAADSLRWRPEPGVDALILRLALPKEMAGGEILGASLAKGQESTLNVAVAGHNDQQVLVRLNTANLDSGRYSVTVQGRMATGEDWQGRVRVLIEPSRDR